MSCNVTYVMMNEGHSEFNWRSAAPEALLVKPLWAKPVPSHPFKNTMSAAGGGGNKGHSPDHNCGYEI